MLAPLLISLSLLTASEEAAKLFLQAIEAANRGEGARAKELFTSVKDRFPSSEESAKANLWLGEPRLLSFKALTKNGPPSRRIDMVALPEAFKEAAGEQRLFLRYAEKAFGFIFESEVMKEYRSYFNTYAAGLDSKDGHVDQFGRSYDTALEGQKIGTLNQVIVSDERVAHYLAGLPIQDGLAFVTVQDEGSGAGNRGVFVLPGEPQRESVLRVFGFGFAELAAESSTSGYESRGLPNESVNVSSVKDPKLVPWAHWIKAIPERIGVYEGGAGAFKGIYRPTADGCVMRGGRDYCVVCREAIVLRIYQRVSPVDDATSGQTPIAMDAALKTEQEIFVQVKDPASHQIQVKFFFSPLTDARPLPAGLRWQPIPDDAANPERVRGPKAPPANWEEVEASRQREGGAPREVLDLKKLLRSVKAKPGHYGIVALATDAATIRGEKLVLKDPDHLLQELLVWEVVVNP